MPTICQWKVLIYTLSVEWKWSTEIFFRQDPEQGFLVSMWGGDRASRQALFQQQFLVIRKARRHGGWRKILLFTCRTMLVVSDTLLTPPNYKQFGHTDCSQYSTMTNVQCTMCSHELHPKLIPCILLLILYIQSKWWRKGRVRDWVHFNVWLVYASVDSQLTY